MKVKKMQDLVKYSKLEGHTFKNEQVILVGNEQKQHD